eukprot:763056-Hanusia_phi.AAC.1
MSIQQAHWSRLQESGADNRDACKAPDLVSLKQESCPAASPPVRQNMLGGPAGTSASHLEGKRRAESSPMPRRREGRVPPQVVDHSSAAAASQQRVDDQSRNLNQSRGENFQGQGVSPQECARAIAAGLKSKSLQDPVTFRDLINVLGKVTSVFVNRLDANLSECDRMTSKKIEELVVPRLRKVEECLSAFDQKQLQFQDKTQAHLTELEQRHGENEQAIRALDDSVRTHDVSLKELVESLKKIQADQSNINQRVGEIEACFNKLRVDICVKMDKMMQEIPRIIQCALSQSSSHPQRNEQGQAMDLSDVECEAQTNTQATRSLEIPVTDRKPGRDSSGSDLISAAMVAYSRADVSQTRQECAEKFVCRRMVAPKQRGANMYSEPNRRSKARPQLQSREEQPAVVSLCGTTEIISDSETEESPAVDLKNLEKTNREAARDPSASTSSSAKAGQKETTQADHPAGWCTNVMMTESAALPESNMLQRSREGNSSIVSVVHDGYDTEQEQENVNTGMVRKRGRSKGSKDFTPRRRRTRQEQMHDHPKFYTEIEKERTTDKLLFNGTPLPRGYSRNVLVEIHNGKSTTTHQRVLETSPAESNGNAAVSSSSSPSPSQTKTKANTAAVDIAEIENQREGVLSIPASASAQKGGGGHGEENDDNDSDYQGNTDFSNQNSDDSSADETFVPPNHPPRRKQGKSNDTTGPSDNESRQIPSSTISRTRIHKKRSTMQQAEKAQREVVSRLSASPRPLGGEEENWPEQPAHQAMHERRRVECSSGCRSGWESVRDGASGSRKTLFVKFQIDALNHLTEEELILIFLQYYGRKRTLNRSSTCEIRQCSFGKALQELWDAKRIKNVEPLDVISHLQVCSYVGCWYKIEGRWFWFIARYTGEIRNDTIVLSNFIDEAAPIPFNLKEAQEDFEKAEETERKYQCFDLFPDSEVDKLKKYIEDFKAHLHNKRFNLYQYSKVNHGDTQAQ